MYRSLATGWMRRTLLSGMALALVVTTPAAARADCWAQALGLCIEQSGGSLAELTACLATRAWYCSLDPNGGIKEA